MVVRQGQTIFRSEPQEHFFDCPYQFAASPEFAPNTDHVDSAAVVEVELQAGDIIVAGTDGLWDNLPEEEVLTLLPSTSDQVHEVRWAATASWPRVHTLCISGMTPVKCRIASNAANDCLSAA